MGMFFLFPPSREQLADWRRAKKVKPLRRAVSMATAEGRALAAEYLGELGDREAIPVLSTALMRDAVPAVRLAAVRALSGMGAAAREPLFRALKEDAEVAVRAEAARGLGEIGGEEVRLALEEALLGDPKGVVRASAARALGRIGAMASIGLLRSSLLAGHPLLTEGAAEALFALSQGASLSGRERAAFLVGLLRFSEAIETDPGIIDLLLLRAALSRDGSALPPGLLDAICRLASPQAVPFLAHRLRKLRLVLSGGPAPDVYERLSQEKEKIEAALHKIGTNEAAIALRGQEIENRE